MNVGKTRCADCLFVFKNTVLEELLLSLANSTFVYAICAIILIELLNRMEPLI